MPDDRACRSTTQALFNCPKCGTPIDLNNVRFEKMRTYRRNRWRST